MAIKRRTVIVGARVLGAIAGVAIAVGSVAAAALVPWPTVTAMPVADRVSPVATAAERVCPGPLLTLAQDSAAATALDPIGSTALTDAAGQGESVERSDLEAPDNGNPDDGVPQLLRVAAQGQAAPLVAGSQSQVAATDTDAGLAVAACTEAAPESWLIGGSTDVGRTTLVLLSNPSTVSATVDLEVFGESGRVDAPGSTGILVQPGQQRVISLAGLAPDVLAPVVHVSAQGGDVAAALQSSIVRGLEPGGVDLVGPVAAPAGTAMITGLVVSDAGAATPGDADAVPTDDQPALRLLAPGDAATTATVSVTGENGAPGTSFSVQLEPGVSVDAPLAGLAAGAYTVEVSADHPVVAAARSAVQGAAGRDIGWFGSSNPVGEAAILIATADGPAPTLHAWNHGGTDAQLTLTPAAGGAPLTLTVPAASSAALPLRPGAAYRLEGAGRVSAAVSYASDSQLASFPLVAAGAAAAPITVYTR